MRFVDTNVWMYAVGRPHPHRDQARQMLRQATVEGHRLFTSAEVLQELLHAYLPVGRENTLVDAMTLATARAEVLPLDGDDVTFALQLRTRHRGLSARDLTHLAVCLRNGARDLLTFDRGLAAAFDAAT